MRVENKAAAGGEKTEPEPADDESTKRSDSAAASDSDPSASRDSAPPPLLNGAHSPPPLPTAPSAPAENGSDSFPWSKTSVISFPSRLTCVSSLSLSYSVLVLISCPSKQLAFVKPSRSIGRTSHL